MNVRGILNLIVLILRMSIINSAKTKMAVYMSKIECPNFEPKLVNNHSCQLIRTSDGLNSFSADFALTEDVKEAKGKYIFSVQRGNNIFNRTAVELDFCVVLANLQSQIFLEMIADELRRVGNFPLHCPFKKNKRYYIEDFTIDSKFIPIYTPELSFKSDCHLIFNKRKALQLIIHGRISRRRSDR